MEPNTSVNGHLALPQLWGMSLDQATAIILPTMIATATLTAVAFAVVAVFSRKWRLGLIILASGALIEILPVAVMALCLDGSLEQVITESIRTWSITFPLVLLMSAIAWFARIFWDDLGVAFEAVLDRWGLRGAIVMIGVILAVFVAVTLVRTALKI